MVKAFIKPLVCIITLSAVRGDTMILKNGDTLDVEVLEITDKEYRIIHNFSKGIKDEKSIPIDDVLKVKKGSLLDNKEYEQLLELLPIPDGKSEAYYTAIIDKEFSPFLEDYPDSEFHTEVKAIISELEKERDLISGGAVKHKGKIVSNDDIDDQLFDYNSEKIKNEVYSLLDDKKILSALRKYESFREGYLNSKAYLSTAKRMNDTLISLKSLLEGKMLKPDTEPDESFYKTLSFNEAKRVKQEFADKKKRVTDVIATEKENKETWLTIDFSSVSSMKDTISLIDARLKEIEEWNEADKIDGGALYTAACNKINDGDVEAAKTAIENFKVISPPAPLFDSLVEKLTSLQEDIKMAEKEALEKEAEDALKDQEDIEKEAEGDSQKNEAEEKVAEDGAQKNEAGISQ